MQSGPIPAGAMKVSLDSNDYPAFVIPGPVFDPAVPWVGPNIVGVLYNSTPAAKALQQSATPIPAGYPHSEEINGELKRFVAQVPPGQPNNLTWLMQGI